MRGYLHRRDTEREGKENGGGGGKGGGKGGMGQAIRTDLQ